MNLNTDIQRLVQDAISSVSTDPAPEGCDLESCQYCGHCAERNLELVKKIIGSGAERIEASPHTSVYDKDVAGKIDHTLLKPETSEKDIDSLCQEARLYEFASVCINPYWINRCSELLDGSPVKVCTVIGFPLGANTKEVKAVEAAKAAADGAEEIDMVINIGAVKSGNFKEVEEDIRYVVNSVPKRITVKVILETALLTNEEKIQGCKAAVNAGADFVKTSTGFAKGGATVEDVRLMRQTVGSALGVKASGGIRSYTDAEAMFKAGANRIGASASVKIVKKENSSDNNSGY